MKAPTKRYFIKDVSVDNTDDDLFNYADISTVLEQILISNKPSFNIAIIGKWGLGKSSLISLVESKLKTNKNFLFQEINAWKYEKESLRRVFLKQLWQGISGKKLQSFQEIQRHFSALINNAIPKSYENFPDGKTIKEKIKSKARDILPLVILAIGTIIAFAIYKAIQASAENVLMDFLFWKKAFLSYCKNVAVTLMFPILISLLTKLHNEYKNKETQKVEFSFPLETTDDYEMFLENEILGKLKSNKEMKFVTVIDDLDRLGLDKIVEALNSIKAFVDLPNCIFIVPFDDEIIKKALAQRRKRQFGEDSDVIESELILDKLFQFKIYLPPLLKYDIKQYTIRLVEREIPDFINDYCPQDIFTRVINRIIIHTGVSTPRQVKKLVNAFVSNFLIAREREESGRVEKGLLTGDKGVEQIAIVSVLQADFNYFYDILFVDFSFIDEFIKIVQNKRLKSTVPEVLQLYFEYKARNNEDENVVGVLPPYETLLNFLISTAKYRVGNIAPFLYLAQDAISMKTGDEQQQRAIAAIESGNSATLKTMIETKPEIVEAIISYVGDCTDIELPLQAVYPIVAFTNTQYVAQLSDIIIERTIEPTTDFMEFSRVIKPSDVLYVAKNSKQKEYGEKAIQNYLSAVAKQAMPDQDQIIDVLKVFIPEYVKISEKSQESIKNISALCVNIASVSSVITILDYTDSKSFSTLWGIGWFNKLCEHIVDENDYSAEVIDSLEKSFAILLNSEHHSKLIGLCIPLFKLPPLLKVLNGIFNETVCSKLGDDISTKIANELVVHNYDEYNEVIHEILNRIKYVINKDNSEIFTAFTQNYTKSESMDTVLVYLGTNNYFIYIEKTLSAFIESIFKDDVFDDLFKKIADYFTKNIRVELFESLKRESSFTQNNNYTREISIISILFSCKNYSNNLEEYVRGTILSKANEGQNYYIQYTYFEFIADVVGMAKNNINDKSGIETYKSKTINLFPSQRSKCFYAVERLSGNFSKEEFTKLFPYLVTNITDSEFERAFAILVDNENVRPQEDDNLNDYQKFLVNHLEKAVNPNKILKILEDISKRYFNIADLTRKAMSNTATDTKILINMITKCLIENEAITDAAKEIVPMFDDNQVFSVLQETFNNLPNQLVNSIFKALIDVLNESTTITVLVNVAKCAVGHTTSNSATIFFEVLKLSINRNNVIEQNIEIIMLIPKLEKIGDETQQKEFINILYYGFLQSSSEKIQGAIIQTVKQKHWTRPFKNKLKENDDKLEIFNKLAK